MLRYESKKDAIVQYIEPENILYFLFQGTSEELDLLGYEIEKYNDWRRRTFGPTSQLRDL